MTQLDDILAIPDQTERIIALIDYAKSLHIDVFQAKNNRGGYSEERLVLLIFDAENNIKHENIRTNHFLTATIITSTIIFVLLFLLPKLVSSIYNAENRVNRPPPKTIKAFDKEGRPILENDQPVLFELMDGTYQEFDVDGVLKYEYFYKQGALLKKISYNKKGEIIESQTYTDNTAAPKP